VTGAKTDRNKVLPSGASVSGVRAPVSLRGEAEKAEGEEPEEHDFVKSTRDTVMEATIDGLVNKVSLWV
jgi:hypothetical protein